MLFLAMLAPGTDATLLHPTALRRGSHIFLQELLAMTVSQGDDAGDTMDSAAHPSSDVGAARGSFVVKGGAQLLEAGLVTLRAWKEYLLASDFTVDDLVSAGQILTAFAHRCSTSSSRVAQDSGADSGSPGGVDDSDSPALPRVWEDAVQSHVADGELLLFLLTDAQASRAQWFASDEVCMRMCVCVCVRVHVFLCRCVCEHVSM